MAGMNEGDPRIAGTVAATNDELKRAEIGLRHAQADEIRRRNQGVLGPTSGPGMDRTPPRVVSGAAAPKIGGPSLPADINVPNPSTEFAKGGPVKDLRATRRDYVKGGPIFR